MWRLGRQHLSLRLATTGRRAGDGVLVGLVCSAGPPRSLQALDTAIIVAGAVAAVLLALVLARVLERRGSWQLVAGAIALALRPGGAGRVFAGHRLPQRHRPACGCRPGQLGSAPAGLGPGGPGPAGPGPPSLPGFGTASDSSAATQTALGEVSRGQQGQCSVSRGRRWSSVGGALSSWPPASRSWPWAASTDRTSVPTLADFQQLVAAKKVRYVLARAGHEPRRPAGRAGCAPPSLGPASGSGPVALDLAQWVQAPRRSTSRAQSLAVGPSQRYRPCDSSEYGGALARRYALHALVALRVPRAAPVTLPVLDSGRNRLPGGSHVEVRLIANAAQPLAPRCTTATRRRSRSHPSSSWARPTRSSSTLSGRCPPLTAHRRDHQDRQEAQDHLSHPRPSRPLLRRRRHRSGVP